MPFSIHLFLWFILIFSFTLCVNIVIKLFLFKFLFDNGFHVLPKLYVTRLLVVIAGIDLGLTLVIFACNKLSLKIKILGWNLILLINSMVCVYCNCHKPWLVITENRDWTYFSSSWMMCFNHVNYLSVRFKYFCKTWKILLLWYII